MLSVLISILGLAATLVGIYLAYLFYINPSKRFNEYLKNPKNWEEYRQSDLSPVDIYRHKYFPDFQIKVSHESLNNDFNEDWIKDYPDKTKETYLVKLIAKGIEIAQFVFLSLDGDRINVPLPKIGANGKKYYYSDLQINLYQVIDKFNTSGEYPITDFISEQKKDIVILASNKDPWFLRAIFWLENILINKGIL